ncbi:GNAT family N-acetyltransferase [Alicyclobacillus sendaiensis]|uniref:GNAT family N-acetyltransferase n=1 Tax=Alicyclobacillus sendaiensis PA2 TaxID=3029425 RepID=A0ABT6XUK2_ALISE|nr:GNAT family N-acetyltransferase [Alicyclobacillus sendaiensis]MDI9258778.1 GNAT family N-acetyltransferase [Alicyclobacillus sendaiensis PA2]
MGMMSYDVWTECDGEWEISTDRNRIDREVVYRFLHDEAYWSRGIPRSLVEQAIENSLCFGVYQRETLIAFARVVSDFATFAYLTDVFVLPEYRGHGVGKALIRSIMKHPHLQSLRRFVLVTSDAHGLYEQFGFRPIQDPGKYMEMITPVARLYEID